jgi:hypothetical protein
MAKVQASEHAETIRAQAEVIHGTHQSGMDRDVQIAQMQSQDWQTLIKVIGQIVASQLKQNATADAGAMVNRDMSEVQR